VVEPTVEPAPVVLASREEAAMIEELEEIAQAELEAEMAGV
jgi:hypothetical protein